MKLMLLFIFAAVFAACDQAPLFYTISMEVAPKTALIPGAVTKIVKGPSNDLYVGNGDLWEFSSGSWGRLDAPGTVRDVAVDDDETLYVLTMDNKSGYTVVWKNEGQGDGWESIGSAANLGYQALFCANNVLFASRWNGGDTSGPSSYTLWAYMDGDTSLSVKISGTALIHGVVYANDDYYFATAGKGVLTWDGSLSSPVTYLASGYILGIIKTDDDIIVAAQSSNNLYQIDTTDNTVKTITRSVIQTGALAVWTNNATPSQQVLLIGISRNDNTNYGYNEVTINTDGTIGTINTQGIFVPNAFHEPGKASPSSVNNYDRYVSTIEKHVVHSLMQAPGVYNKNNLPVVFASTKKDGLWAYRDDASVGEPVWNAQE